MGGSKILRIFGLIFTLIGAFLIVWQYMTGRAPGLRIFFVVLTIAGLVAIVYEFGREIRARVVTVERLEDAESIRRSFTKMLQDAKRVLFVGALDDALAEAILQRWNSRVDGEHLRVGVYNTDPDFHGTEGPAAELAKHCADHESFDFRFIFYRQTVDSLAVVRQKDRSDVLFRWRDGAGQPKGLRVKDTVWPFGEFLREVPVATIDDVCGNQGPELKSVRDLFEEYCQPLKSGWSYPVLPLREWEAVQAEITAHNLKWFNDAATRLIEYGSPALNTVCVTWCLHDGSAQDGKVFAQWLDRLRTSSVAVNR